MSIKQIPAFASSMYYKARFYGHKYEPEIYMGASIVSGIACVVTTAIAARKVDGVIEEHKDVAKQIKARAAADPDFNEGKALTKLYFKTGFKFGKLFTIPASLGAASIGFRLKSLDIVKKDNLMLAAVAATAEKKLNDYRQNAIEKFGAEVDRELAGGLKQPDDQKTEALEDGKDNSKKSDFVPETEKHFTGQYSPWARFFGPGKPGWEDPASAGPGCNQTYIVLQEEALNKLMKYRHGGYLTMNNIYKVMGYTKVDEGNDWGIIFDRNGPEKQFNFCLRKKGNTNGAAFLNGETDEVWLDFDNVQYIKGKFLPSNKDIWEMQKENARLMANQENFPDL